MDKKYRSDDKKLVFIHNCLPNIPSEDSQLQEKNISDDKHRYYQKVFTSPPMLKAYNNRMGGVDKHDRLIGNHQIKISSKRGYIKVFFHLLDSELTILGFFSRVQERQRLFEPHQMKGDIL